MVGWKGTAVAKVAGPGFGIVPVGLGFVVGLVVGPGLELGVGGIGCGKGFVIWLGHVVERLGICCDDICG